MITEETYQSEIGRITTVLSALGVSKAKLKPIFTQSGSVDERLLYRLIAIADVLEEYANSNNSGKAIRTKRTASEKSDNLAQDIN